MKRLFYMLLLAGAISMLGACVTAEEEVAAVVDTPPVQDVETPELPELPEPEAEPESVLEPEDETEVDLEDGDVTYEEEAVEEEPETNDAPDAEYALVGTWTWMGSPYYVLEADGQGTMVEMPIRWWSLNGVFSFCSTPSLCGTTCIAPTEWYYELEGDELLLTSTLIPDMSFTYNRR